MASPHLGQKKALLCPSGSRSPNPGQVEELHKKIFSVEQTFQTAERNWLEPQKTSESDIENRDSVVPNIKKDHEMKSVVQSQNRREQELHKQLHEIEATTNTSMKTLRHRESELECSREREERLKAELEYQSRRLQELYKQLHEMEAEKNSHLDNFMHNKNELAYSQEREKRLAGELETARHRIKRLEANFEAERSAHLVSKLNSEMIQMWAQDLESSFQVEKDKYSQIASDSEMIKNQFNEMKTAYKREKTRADENAEKLKRLDEEFSSLTNQLKSEIDEKNRLATELSSKLKNIEECHMKLEEDFAEAKKRHSCLEESYGSNMRELQSMVESFNVSSQRTSGIYNDKVQAADPAAVLQTLRHTLTDYQSRLEGTSNELETAEKLCVQMSEELESFKHKIQSLGTNLENMQSELREVNMELSHLRSKYADKESQIGSIQKDLAESQHGWEKEKLRVMEAKKEIQFLTRTYQKDTEENQTFLYSLYQRLLSRGVLIKQPESMLDQFSWSELCLVLQENVDVLISDLNRANEKLSHLEYVCKNKSDAMMELQKSHEDSLNKLAAEMKAQDRCWQKQRRDLEQHYSALLSEVQARAQGLSEAKQELRRKDQSLRQLTRKLSQLEQDKNRLEQDKNRLEESIHNSESDLRMAAKDREFLANHMKSVEIVFQKVRDQISLSWSAAIRNDFTVHLPKLHSEIFAVEGHLGGSEFTICQNMIRSFLDVYQLAWSKTTALEREIASHQKHIADLKSELQTACLGGNARLPTPVDYDRNSVLSARSESLLDKTTEPDFLPINAGTENHSSHMKYGYVASRSYSTRSSVFSLSTSPMQKLPDAN